jgi:hypothetical protein
MRTVRPNTCVYTYLRTRVCTYVHPSIHKRTLAPLRPLGAVEACSHALAYAGSKQNPNPVDVDVGTFEQVRPSTEAN